LGRSLQLLAHEQAFANEAAVLLGEKWRGEASGCVV
jgi:hypothetical protein